MASANDNKMGAVELTFLTAVNMMGSGIIMLPTKLASVGTMSIFSWLITAGGSMALAYVFAKCGLFTRRGGGMGGYAEYGFGKAGNFMTNYTYGVSLLVANVGVALTAVGYGQVVFDMELDPVGNAAATIALLWICSVLNFGGAKITGRIGSVTVFGCIIPVVLLSLIGWFWFDGSMYMGAWNVHNMPFFEAIGVSIPLTLWSFLGLESACANTDAVENPEKNVPIAVLAGTLGCAIVYIASTNVMAGIVPNAQLAESTAPYGLCFAMMFGDSVGKLAMIAMAIACVGCLLGWQFTIGSVFRSGAEEGYFPAIFKKVTATDTPVIGIIILTAIQTGFCFMTVSPTFSEQFDMIVNLTVVTNMIPYLFSMAAIDVMQRCRGESSGTLVFIAFLATAYSLYACYESGYEAMMGGGLLTFFGWFLYGLISKNYDLEYLKKQDEEIMAAQAKEENAQ